MASIIPVPQNPQPGFAVGPGMTTSNVAGSTYSTMSPTEQLAWQRYQDEQKEKRKQEWAEASAERAAQQQPAQDAAEREKVHAAFNMLYGPQMQRAYHDQMVMSEGVPGTGVQNRYGLGQALTGGGGSQQSRLSSGNMKPWDTSWTPKGGWYQLPQEKLNTALDNMWRMQTDPYMRAAGSLGKGMPLGYTGLMGEANPMTWGKQRGKGRTRTSKVDAEQEEKGGIDWQKKNVRPGYEF